MGRRRRDRRALGSSIPILAIPLVSSSLRVHPAYSSSVRTLTGANVVFLDGNELKVRLKDGDSTLDWKRITGELSRATGGRR